MSGHDFRSALQDADRVLSQVKLSTHRDARIRSALRKNPSASWGQFARYAVASFALVAALFVVKNLWWSATPALPFQVIESSKDFRASNEGEDFVVIEGQCQMQAPAGVHLAVRGPSRLRNERDGVRVLGGTVDVRVEKRQVGEPPARTLVSGGVIEVLGTHYVVTESGSNGSVTLVEGAIRFVPTQGQPVRLDVGQTLHWPVAVQQPFDPKLDAGAKSDTTEEAQVDAAIESSPASTLVRPVDSSQAAVAPVGSTTVDDVLVTETLQKIERLRSRGEQDEAIRLLRHALSKDLRPATRERFSFELGLLLSNKAEQKEAACAYWRKEFANGSERYRVDVNETMLRLGCGAGKK